MTAHDPHFLRQKIVNLQKMEPNIICHADTNNQHCPEMVGWMVYTEESNVHLRS